MEGEDVSLPQRRQVCPAPLRYQEVLQDLNRQRPDFAVLSTDVYFPEGEDVGLDDHSAQDVGELQISERTILDNQFLEQLVLQEGANGLAVEVLHIVDVSHLEHLILQKIQRIRVDVDCSEGRYYLVIVKDGALLMVWICWTDITMAIDVLITS